MKTLIYIGLIAAFIWGCTTNKTIRASADDKVAANDTIRIANDSLEYEVIIIDPAFNSWLNSRARPRGFYTQHYMEVRNISWVAGWNNRYYTSAGGHDLFLMPIDYRQGIDYGYEVNYLLFNYLTYFQLKNNLQLGSFVPRI